MRYELNLADQTLHLKGKQWPVHVLVLYGEALDTCKKCGLIRYICSLRAAEPRRPIPVDHMVLRHPASCSITDLKAYRYECCSSWRRLVILFTGKFYHNSKFEDDRKTTLQAILKHYNSSLKKRWGLSWSCPYRLFCQDNSDLGLDTFSFADWQLSSHARYNVYRSIARGIKPHPERHLPGNIKNKYKYQAFRFVISGVWKVWWILSNGQY